MSTTKLTSNLFKQMIEYGVINLTINREHINRLNVFPVPDGDTGTNMDLSLSAGAKEIDNVASEELNDLLTSFMKGILMGARGNSGVILSQLFRGFSEYIQRENEVTSTVFANALQHGVTVAYQSVSNPVEGTILTVAKDAANVALSVAETERILLP